MDGTKYKEKGILFRDSLSLTCNIDGVPVFLSSNVSLWPIYYTINELPLIVRRKHVILHALWSGIGKPRMDCFLKPVVDELKMLYEVGFNWVRNSVAHTTRVHLGLICCDSVAHALLQNFKQFNGAFGCSFRMSPGTIVPKGCGSVLLYLIDAEYKNCSHKETLEHAKTAGSTKASVYGVKGCSILSFIPNFDIVTGFNLEPMHLVLLGVVRQFANL